MKIIISPTKKMKIDDTMSYRELPSLIDKTKILKEAMQEMSKNDLRKLWQCNDSIIYENIQRLVTMNLESNLSCAIYSYVGIQFQYMAPNIFTSEELDYVEKHLRILSGFYGLLKPLDGITPYRLEMGARLQIGEYKNIYDFWHDDLYKALEDDLIINLASNEYSKCISKYLKESDSMIHIYFGFMINGKFKIKATLAKMARGEMVRYLAKNKVETYKEVLEALKAFHELDFKYNAQMSDETHFYFLGE